MHVEGNQLSLFQMIIVDEMMMNDDEWWWMMNDDEDCRWWWLLMIKIDDDDVNWWWMIWRLSMMIVVDDADDMMMMIVAVLKFKSQNFSSQTLFIPNFFFFQNPAGEGGAVGQGSARTWKPKEKILKLNSKPSSKCPTQSQFFPESLPPEKMSFFQKRIPKSCGRGLGEGWGKGGGKVLKQIRIFLQSPFVIV
jgi:hypothetical protein